MKDEAILGPRDRSRCLISRMLFPSGTVLLPISTALTFSLRVIRFQM